jgi:CRP-like cAMP-binding protein
MEDIKLLKTLFFFHDLDTLELAKVNAVTHRAVFSPGEVIIEEGSTGHSMYLVKEGSVSVRKGGSVITSLGAGDPLGEVAFIDRGIRSASVVANGETVLIEIPGDALDDTLSRNPKIACKIYRSINRTLCQRLRKANTDLL